MNGFKNVIATWLATLMLCCAGYVLAQSGELDSTEAYSLEFLLLFSAQKGLEYGVGNKQFGVPFLTDFAADEEQNVELLNNLADQYAIEINDEWWGCFRMLRDFDELEFLCALLRPSEDWRNYWDEFVLAAAFMEEMSIRELQKAIEYTDEQTLIDAYNEMLGMASIHLVRFASTRYANPLDYEAQLLDQSIVDAVLAEAVAKIAENFEINPGLNDAWYDPATSGQGFFIAVYPEVNTMVLAWLTYDTDLPGEDAIAGVGDSCQRWLTAQGSYDGSQADLTVYNSRGGLFDASHPVPATEPIGSIILNLKRTDRAQGIGGCCCKLIRMITRG